MAGGDLLFWQLGARPAAQRTRAERGRCGRLYLDFARSPRPPASAIAGAAAARQKDPAAGSLQLGDLRESEGIGVRRHGIAVSPMVPAVAMPALSVPRQREPGRD